MSTIFMPLFVMLCAVIFAPITQSATQQEGKVLGGKHTDYPDWFKASFLDINEDITESGEEGKMLMLLFVLNNCPYCHALVERNMSQQSIKDTLQTQFDVVLINMRGDQEVIFVDGKSYTEKTLSEALGVQFTPTLLFFNPKSKTPAQPVLRLNGYVPPTQFAQALSYLTSNSTLSLAEYRSQQKNSNAKTVTQVDFLTPIDDLHALAGTPFVLFFEQPDCPDCQAMHNKIYTHPSLHQAFKNLPSYQVNIRSKDTITTKDGTQIPKEKFAEQMNIQYAPTIVVFNEQDEEIIRSLWLEIFHLETMLRYALTGSHKKTRFQDFLNERSRTTRAAGKDVHLWGNENN